MQFASRYGVIYIRKQSGLKDTVRFVAKEIWKWANDVARRNDNRLTKRITDWQPRNGKRSRERPARRSRNEIVQQKG